MGEEGAPTTSHALKQLKATERFRLCDRFSRHQVMKGTRHFRRFAALTGRSVARLNSARRAIDVDPMAALRREQEVIFWFSFCEIRT